jgi:hypothetical protein
MTAAKKFIVSMIAVIFTLAALDALAQFGGGNRGRMGGGQPAGGGMQRGEATGGGDNLGTLLEYRLESFQEDLKLTPNQQKLWDVYADRVRALGTDIVRERERARTPEVTQLPAPRQIDHVLDVARNRMTALEDIAASAKTLYESLTPDQKLLADSRVATLVPLIAGSGPASGAPDTTRPKPASGDFGRGSRGRDAGLPR